MHKFSFSDKNNVRTPPPPPSKKTEETDQYTANEELSEKPTGRRHFSLEEKLQILREAEACIKPGELQAFLEERGLYHSLLSNWRKQIKESMCEALAPKKRGRPPKTKEVSYLVKRIADLEQEKLELAQRIAELEEFIVTLKEPKNPLPHMYNHGKLSAPNEWPENNKKRPKG